MKFREFVSFEKFLTPILVKVAYWIGIVSMILLGVVGIYNDGEASDGRTVIIGSVAVFIVAMICWRVVCESFILVFKIYDRLTEIRDQGTPRE